MNWRNIILAIVLAGLLSSGTFTCRSDNNTATFTDNPSSPEK
jgi:hypothetical protein